MALGTPWTVSPGGRWARGWPSPLPCGTHMLEPGVRRSQARSAGGHLSACPHLCAFYRMTPAPGSALWANTPESPGALGLRFPTCAVCQVTSRSELWVCSPHAAAHAHGGHMPAHLCSGLQPAPVYLLAGTLYLCTQGSAAERLPSAQAVTPGAPDRVPRRAPHGSLLLPLPESLPLSVSLSVSHK